MTVDISSAERLWIAREKLDAARKSLMAAVRNLDIAGAGEATHSARFAVLQVEDAQDELKRTAAR